MNTAPVERGIVAWAAVTSVTRAQLRVWRGATSEAENLDAVTFAHQLCDAKQGGCTLLVEASLRPVVLLQDRPRGVLEDVLALGVVSLTDLSSVQRKKIREQQEPSLFHLPARPKYGLSQETAVDLNGLMRIGRGALLPRAVGRLDDNEIRVIGERLVAHLDIDLEPIVARQVDERLQQLSASGML